MNKVYINMHNGPFAGLAFFSGLPGTQSVHSAHEEWVVYGTDDNLTKGDNKNDIIIDHEKKQLK